jgi:hypothetical protein
MRREKKRWRGNRQMREGGGVVNWLLDQTADVLAIICLGRGNECEISS